MVDALTFPLQKLANRPAFSAICQQLYFVWACPEKGGTNPLRRHFLFLIRRSAQQLLKQLVGSLQVLYRYADMLYFVHYR